MSVILKNELSGYCIVVLPQNKTRGRINSSLFFPQRPQSFTLQAQLPVEKTLIVHFWGAFTLLTLSDWSSQQ